MTLENAINLLNAYKKQMENPVNESGMPLKGDQRKHAISQSENNYKKMLKHIEEKKSMIIENMNNPDPKFAPYWRYQAHPLFQKPIEVKKEIKAEFKKEVKK